MKTLLSVLLLSFAFPALALVEPMTSDDYETLRKSLVGESADVSIDQGNRIFPVIKLEAATGPQNLVELGVIAKKLSEQIAKEGLKDETIVKSAGIFVAMKANENNFNLTSHSDAEKAALQNIENLRTSLKK